MDTRTHPTPGPPSHVSTGGRAAEPDPRTMGRDELAAYLRGVPTTSLWPFAGRALGNLSRPATYRAASRGSIPPWPWAVASAWWRRCGSAARSCSTTRGWHHERQQVRAARADAGSRHRWHLRRVLRGLLAGADTGLAFTGEAEWIITGMMMLGIPEDQATIMVGDFTGCDHGEVPDGVITIPVAVCRECASRARAGKMTTGFKVGLLVDGLPNYAQRVKS